MGRACGTPELSSCCAPASPLVCITSASCCHPSLWELVPRVAPTACTAAGTTTQGCKEQEATWQGKAEPCGSWWGRVRVLRTHLTPTSRGPWSSPLHGGGGQPAQQHGHSSHCNTPTLPGAGAEVPAGNGIGCEQHQGPREGAGAGELTECPRLAEGSSVPREGRGGLGQSPAPRCVSPPPPPQLHKHRDRHHCSWGPTEQRNLLASGFPPAGNRPSSTPVDAQLQNRAESGPRVPLGSRNRTSHSSCPVPPHQAPRSATPQPSLPPLPSTQRTSPAPSPPSLSKQPRAGSSHPGRGKECSPLLAAPQSPCCRLRTAGAGFVLVSVPGAGKRRGGAVRPGKALGRHSAAPEAAGKAQGGAGCQAGCREGKATWHGP